MTNITRADMRAAQEHVERAMEHLGKAIDRLAAPECLDEHEGDLCDLVYVLSDAERNLGNWIAPAIRLRQQFDAAV